MSRPDAYPPRRVSRGRAIATDPGGHAGPQDGLRHRAELRRTVGVRFGWSNAKSGSLFAASPNLSLRANAASHAHRPRSSERRLVHPGGLAHARPRFSG